LSTLQQAAFDNNLNQVLQLYRTEYATALVAELAVQWSAARLPELRQMVHGIE
jgi:hypothetical protein